jgi:hypothetical protein
VNLVLGTLELTTIGGVGTYLVTVAEQVQRLGHEVTIHAEDTGEMAEIARDRGLRVVSEADQLPARCDAVYAQDAPSAYALADRYRDAPQAFCVHADEHDRWVVPQLPGVIGATIAVHERVARHARSMAYVPEVVRLRQPVDTRRFSPRGPIRPTPRRALVLGNYTWGNRLELIRTACAEAGIECVQRGLHGDEFALSPEGEMNDSDIVLGKARVVVEAMACGRAAYVYDHNGGDGWVTPGRYAMMEADNFGGQAEPRPLDAAGLRDDLLAYRSDMGPANRDLAVAHHSARKHVQELVKVLRRLAPRAEPVAGPLDELARLNRVLWQADARALGFEHEARLLRTELGKRERRQAKLTDAVAAMERRALAAEQEAERARRAVAELEADAAAFRSTLRYRAAAALARPLDAARRARRHEG